MHTLHSIPFDMSCIKCNYYNIINNPCRTRNDFEREYFTGPGNLARVMSK